MLSNGLVTRRQGIPNPSFPSFGSQNGPVRFRSHLLRPLDLTDPWNRTVLALSAVAGVTGAYLTLAHDREIFLAIEAAAYTFLGWALARELDPDRQLTAIVLGVLAGVWALLGYGTVLLPFVGLLASARIVVETTGRRPLPTDLATMAVLAAVISFTPLGWVVGFGLAIAIYIDDRMSGEPTRVALFAALGAAIGSTVVASLSDAFPRSFDITRPLLIAALGLLALITVVREPLDPTSFVDSRSKKFLRKDRLQAGRALCAIVLFVGALVSGGGAHQVLPMALVVAFSLVSSEVERSRRPDPASG
jgi:hypothetical protein